MTTRVSMNELRRYAAIVGAPHGIDLANEARQRREAAELCALLVAIGTLVIASVFSVGIVPLSCDAAHSAGVATTPLRRVAEGIEGG